MAKHITTIEDLAVMINTHMASKEDVQALDKKVQALDTKVTTGFDRIEHLLLEEQHRKIENLETRMKKLGSPGIPVKTEHPLDVHLIFPMA
jgi:hypothetical protein